MARKNENLSPEIHIGTSGWSYTHWKENFYPNKLPTSQWLKFYSTQFSTVEINSTFYRSPLSSTVKKWHEDVPEDFSFSIKASRYITHQKKLHDCDESLKFFYKSVQGFQNKMGPILFQLSPTFKMNKERLEKFISLLKKEYQYTFEFRHASWFTNEIYDLLLKHQMALCITDLNGDLSPEELTANFTYIRLHGPKKAYSGSYSLANLKQWKKRIENWMKQGISIYCYFDNDEKGYAAHDAKILKDLFTT